MWDIKRERMTKIDDESEGQELGNLLLDIGSSLLVSGASCSRIQVTMKRFASTYQYEMQVSVHPTSVSLALYDDQERLRFNGIRGTGGLVVNFETLAGISKLSWDTLEQNLSLSQVKEQLDEILKRARFPRWLVLSTVSFAGSAFCFSFGGTWTEMLLTFGATFAGLWSRQEMGHRKFNPYICVFVGSLVASLFVGIFIKMGLDIQFDNAFATSVLFLIPGIPLINCLTDMIDGHTLTGLARGLNASIIALAIAMGLLFTMFVFQIH
jgi:uncharacterized membrane protein YjjP (DUF1212 family)